MKRILRHVLPAFTGLLLLSLAIGGIAQEHDDHDDGARTGEQHAVEAAGDTDGSAAATREAEPEGPPGVVDFLRTPKFLFFGLLMLIGFVLLRMGWLRSAWVRVGMLAAAFILYGLDYFFPLHPSPMCATTKLFMFRFTWGEFFPVFLALFLAMMVPSLIGRKLFCGWVCPLGALQELVNKIPFRPRFRRVSFLAMNSIRLALLAMFVLTFFAVKDQIGVLAERLEADPSAQTWTVFSSYSVYDPVNFFELLHWQVTAHWIVLFSILIVSSLVLYRPFCYTICPIGALTWFLEKVAPARIRLDHLTCTDCGECEQHSPCTTIYAMKERRRVLPDCTSCGECMRVCPEGAITFGFRSK